MSKVCSYSRPCLLPDCYIFLGGSVTDRNLVRLFEILESGILPWQKNSVYLWILYFNYHEILFGIWNLCQKTVGFGISYRNLVGVRPLDFSVVQAQQVVKESEISIILSHLVR